LHGGSVTVHSAGAGRGSEFVVRVPGLVEGSEPRRRDAVADSVPKPGPARSRRVLVVDDNEDAADSLGALLESSGHEVAIAYDGASALEIAGRFDPEVAVLDVGLPVMDGYELVGALRERLARRSCRFLALTGYGQSKDIERAAAAGFERLLVKPVNVDLLEQLLAEAP